MRHCFNLLPGLRARAGMYDHDVLAPVNRGDAMSPTADAEEVRDELSAGGLPAVRGRLRQRRHRPRQLRRCGTACAAAEVCPRRRLRAQLRAAHALPETSAADGGADGSAADAPAQGDAAEGGARRRGVRRPMSNGRHCGACNRACADGGVPRGTTCRGPPRPHRVHGGRPARPG